MSIRLGEDLVCHLLGSLRVAKRFVLYQNIHERFHAFLVPLHRTANDGVAREIYDTPFLRDSGEAS